MEQYISKSDLVVEIERYKHKADERLKMKDRTLSDDMKDLALQNLCGNLLHFINTLEVKEVQEEPVSNDLEDYAKHYLLHEHISPLNEILHQADLKVEMQYHKDIENAFKAGFKLGLKAQKGE